MILEIYQFIAYKLFSWFSLLRSHSIFSINFMHRNMIKNLFKRENQEIILLRKMKIIPSTFLTRLQQHDAPISCRTLHITYTYFYQDDSAIIHLIRSILYTYSFISIYNVKNFLIFILYSWRCECLTCASVVRACVFYSLLFYNIGFFHAF